jgi:symplekin
LKSDSTADADKCRNPPDHPVNGRIQQFLERMHRTRVEVFDESNRKRPAPSEPTDGLDQAKRQRLAAEPPSRTPSVQPLPPGEVSWRQLYTLNAEGSTANFDVQNFRDPEQLLRIVVPVLQSVNPQKLEQAINVCDVPFPTCRPPVGLRCTILLFNTNSASTCQL